MPFFTALFSLLLRLSVAQLAARFIFQAFILVGGYFLVGYTMDVIYPRFFNLDLFGELYSRLPITLVYILNLLKFQIAVNLLVTATLCAWFFNKIAPMFKTALVGGALRLGTAAAAVN